MNSSTTIVSVKMGVYPPAITGKSHEKGNNKTAENC
jgi:hypothetical protein